MMLQKQLAAGDLPAEYQRINYLESSGAQYIKTGFIPQAGAGMSAEYEITDGYAQSRYYIVGCYGGNNKGRFQFSPSAPAFCGYGDLYSNTVPVDKVSGKRTAQIRNGDFLVDGNLIYTSDSTLFDGTAEVCLFALNGNGAMSSCATNLRVYSLNLLSGDAVVRSFIPALRTAGSKPGLYDTVTKTFFTNAGTGEFIWG